jgi:acyl carrier protein
MQDITYLLREVVADLLEVDVSEVTADADIEDVLCLESLQQLELMVRVEDRLCVTFDIETWIARRTVRDLASHISTLQNDGDAS